jgi:hypothetical protein
MVNLLFALRSALGSILFVALFATGSMAQNNRTFVSGAGSDSNPCSLTSPFRTFGQAISVTNSGGEVIVLTSAGYGRFTINKAVTVEAPAGVYAGITATGSSDSGSSDGIDINAGPMDTVILRGLTVNGQDNTGGNGIVFNSGAALHIESCVVNGFTDGGGITINNFGNIFVTDTIARSNFDGILFEASGAGKAYIAMDNVYLDDNAGTGLLVGPDGSSATVTAAIRNSSTSDDSGSGMAAIGSDAHLDIENCLIANDGAGVFATNNATVSISNCAITGCSFGYNNVGGTIDTRGQNTVIGNEHSGGNLTALAGQ